MRIAVDARELAGHVTGVGRYLTELLKAWNQSPDAGEHEFALLAHKAVALPALPNLRVVSQVRPGSGGTLWEQLVLPGLVRHARADVLFAPAYTAPLRSPVPVVVTVHDVSFCAHPEWFSWREGLRRRVVTRRSAHAAARVLTVSRFSRDEIVRLLGVPPSRVQVIHSGPSDLVASPGNGRSGRRVILYVGSVLARRHVLELVDGFARLARRRPEVHLAIVGDPRGVPPIDVAAHVRAAGLDRQVTVRGYVSDAELAALYGEAAAFAFLSSYEGFGLTPLDAIASGIPTVVLDTPVAREVYGDAAHRVATLEPQSVEAALEQVLFDPAERTRLAEAWRGMAGRHTWAASGRDTLAALTSVAG
jgi:glycosyltransferase involved in cell wall biosynthesis